MTIVERLRHAAIELRVRPTPLSTFIPLLQQAADRIDALETWREVGHQLASQVLGPAPTIMVDPATGHASLQYPKPEYVVPEWANPNRNR